MFMLNSCVITTMCAFDQEYQFINPSTQVALYSVSDEPCLPPCSIEWTTYAGTVHSITQEVIWNVHSAMSSAGKIHFYGEIHHRGG